MIDASPDQGSVARRLFGSSRRRLLLGTALAVIASASLIGGDAILASPTAQAAATESSGQHAQAPDFADLAQKVSPAVVSIRVRESAPVAGLAPTQGFDNLPPEFRR